MKFEKAWQEKFESAIAAHAGREIRDTVMSVCPTGDSVDSPEAIILWTAEAIERLDQAVDERQAQAILLDCGCQYPAEAIEPIAADFQAHGDIDRALEKLQELFLRFLREDLQLTEEQIDMIVERGWGLAGRRDGDTVIATKIPKSEYLSAYLGEVDPQKRRQYYCHCPRIRDASAMGIFLSATYCYCGGGFYRGIWERILGRDVQIEMLQSVLRGDEVCQFRVNLR
ncbi:MAG: DUF6144 family protein [Anaerolineales bacterium]